MVTASIATLRYAAKFRDDVLYNRYQSGRNMIKQYRHERDRTRTSSRRSSAIRVAPVELLRRFAFHGVSHQPTRSRRDVQRHDVSQGHVGHSDESGVRVSSCSEVFEVQKYPGRRRRQCRTTPPAGRCPSRWA